MGSSAALRSRTRTSPEHGEINEINEVEASMPESPHLGKRKGIVLVGTISGPD